MRSPGPPSSYAQALSIYGNPAEFTNDIFLWERVAIREVGLPFALLDGAVLAVRVHKLVAGALGDAFDRLLRAGLQADVQEFNGSYRFQPAPFERADARTFGATIVLNASSGVQPAGVVEAFLAARWTWLGDRIDAPDASTFTYGNFD